MTRTTKAAEVAFDETGVKRELAGNTWTGWWIYWVGPIAGALVASLVYEYLYLRPVQPPVVGAPDSGVDEPRPGEAAVS